MSLHPGLVSVTFRALSPEDVIRLAASHGLRGIEWGGDVHVPVGVIPRAREVARATREAGLAVAAYGSYYRVAESEASGLNFSAVCETASALEAPTIRVWAGTKNSEDASEAYWQSVVEDLHRIARIASDAGMTISLEFHGNTLTNTAESTARLLAATPPDSVYTYWQPPVGLASDEALEGLGMVLDRLSNVHVFHWWPGNRDRHPLETGRSRWLQYLDLIRTVDRPCWAMLEFLRDDDPRQLADDARTLHDLLKE